MTVLIEEEATQETQETAEAARVGRALRALREFGWIQDEYVQGPDGELLRKDWGNATGFCIVGAFYFADSRVDHSRTTDFEDPVAHLLGFENAEDLIDWNDAEDRMEAEVFDLLESRRLALLG